MNRKYRMPLIAIGSVVLGLAQQPGAPAESGKGVVQKKLAPVSKEMLRVRLPKPAERKLKNGLPVLIVEKHKLPAVQFELALPASNLTEPAELTGLAECTAEMLGYQDTDGKTDCRDVVGTRRHLEHRRSIRVQVHTPDGDRSFREPRSFAGRHGRYSSESHISAGRVG